MIKCYIIKYNEYAAFSVSKVTLRLGFFFCWYELQNECISVYSSIDKDNRTKKCNLIHSFMPPKTQKKNCIEAVRF